MNDNIITVENLTKDFRDTRVLDNISFEIKRGEIFGIIGPSGAGKSTLIRCLNMLERPTSGKIVFNDVDIVPLRERHLAKIRQQIGMIFQSFNLLAQRNVLRNVHFPLEVARNKTLETKTRALELLNLVGLSDKVREYPRTLSGGQKQRVAIARAVVNNPAVLLCDEPTSALDEKCTDEVLNLLRDINEKFNLTIIIITHEMSVIEKICNRVATIENGKIIEIRGVKQNG
ncbi:MAG: ATP-binding cassette domain-containing protein [Firmicutes bacterium]|nr:ATP-binding cassette domain-containing protein [Bacillota bacterium]